MSASCAGTVSRRRRSGQAARTYASSEACAWSVVSCPVYILVVYHYRQIYHTKVALSYLAKCEVAMTPLCERISPLALETVRDISRPHAERQRPQHRKPADCVRQRCRRSHRAADPDPGITLHWPSDRLGNDRLQKRFPSFAAIAGTGRSCPPKHTIHEHAPRHQHFARASRRKGQWLRPQPAQPLPQQSAYLQRNRRIQRAAPNNMPKRDEAILRTRRAAGCPARRTRASSTKGQRGHFTPRPLPANLLLLTLQDLLNQRLLVVVALADLPV